MGASSATCRGSVGHLSRQLAGSCKCSSPHKVAFSLFSAYLSSSPHRVEDVFCEKRDDPTSLTSVLQQTELVGLLRMLYAMLLHDGPPRHSSTPPILPPHTLSISTACLRAINNFAILDLRMVQVMNDLWLYFSGPPSLLRPVSELRAYLWSSDMLPATSCGGWPVIM